MTGLETVALALGASSGVAATIGTVGGVVSGIASIGMTIYSMLSRPKQVVEGPRLGSLTLQSSTRGAALPEIWGSLRISGNLIDGEKKEVITEEDQGGGSGLFGGGTTVRTYTYYATFAISLCDCPPGRAIAGVRRMWLNNRLWYDGSDTAGDDAKRQSNIRRKYFKVYNGDYYQLPDPALEGIRGAGNVPAYRGTAYIVFDNLELTDFGNALPQVSVEITQSPFAFPPMTRIPDPEVGTGLCAGGLYCTNSCLDPDTGRVFITQFDVGAPPTARTKVNVYDKNMAFLGSIPLPFATGNQPASTPCFVASRREIWVPYASNPNTWMNVNTGDADYEANKQQWFNTFWWSRMAVIDADTLTLTNQIQYPALSPGPAYYNYKTEEVLGFDNGNGGTAASFATTMGGMVNPNPLNTLTPASLVFTALPLPECGMVAVVGFGHTLEFFSDWDYTPLGSVSSDPTIFSGLQNWLAWDPVRFQLWWANAGANGVPTNQVYRIDLSDWAYEDFGGNGGGMAAMHPITLPAPISLPYKNQNGGGFCYSPYLDRLYMIWRAGNQDYVAAIVPDTLNVYENIPVNIPSMGLPTLMPGQGYLTPIDAELRLLKGDTIIVPIYPTASTTKAPLWRIVTDLCEDSFLTAADIDVSDLNDLVHGFAREAPMELAQALQPLMSAYLFDVAESGWKLRFIKRGANSILTIPEGDLATVDYGEDPGPPVTVSRAQEVELPTRLTVHYISPSYNYQQGSRFAKRFIGYTKNEVLVDLPIALEATEVTQLSSKLLNNFWLERDRFKFSLPIDYLALDPTDVVTLDVDRSFYQVRITKIDLSANTLRLECEGSAAKVPQLTVGNEIISDDPAADIYTSSLTATDTPSVVDQMTLLAGGTRTVLLDIPLLRDQDDDPGHYSASAPFDTTVSWPGAVIYKSVDQGWSYSSIATATTAAIIGGATTLLPAGPTTIWDNGNTVTVNTRGGVLLSDSETNVLSGSNAALLGSHGRWELFQWKTATYNNDGTYTLSNLLRGRKGTEWAVGMHAVGDTFIHLTRTSIDHVITTASDKGVQYHYKAVTQGRTLQRTTAQVWANDEVILKPYSPVHLKGSRDANDDWTLTWVRRTRYTAEWMDGVDAPLGETSEEYEVEILQNGNVVRTITGLSSPSVVYNAADQTTDFGAPQTSLTFTVYQRSSEIGRGYPATATV